MYSKYLGKLKINDPVRVKIANKYVGGKISLITFREYNLTWVAGVSYIWEGEHKYITVSLANRSNPRQT